MSERERERESVCVCLCVCVSPCEFEFNVVKKSQSAKMTVFKTKLWSLNFMALLADSFLLFLLF